MTPSTKNITCCNEQTNEICATRNYYYVDQDIFQVGLNFLQNEDPVSLTLAYCLNI